MASFPFITVLLNVAPCSSHFATIRVMLRLAAPSAVGRSSRSSGEWWMREVRQAVWQHRRWARNEGSWNVSLASLARYLVVPDSLP